MKLLHLQWINEKVPLHSIGDYIQYPGINHNRKEYKKNVYTYINIYMYMCGYNCHFAVQQKLTQRCESTTLQQKKREKRQCISIINPVAL